MDRLLSFVTYFDIPVQTVAAGLNVEYMTTPYVSIVNKTATIPISTPIPPIT